MPKPIHDRPWFRTGLIVTRMVSISMGNIADDANRQKQPKKEKNDDSSVTSVREQESQDERKENDHAYAQRGRQNQPCSHFNG